ncbi:type II toxin-antitoxin system RelB family antitoxin [Bifidobacterium crudilactis]|uniref:type II toxin-antitoxin system RelB family antitoxin n=1 Tax=Bifidobacterium crudilactis TaxID=327277 RepID=UPI0005534299|nr:DUF6290 family protein [Bifidobacterium crudilactis]MCI2148942.1 DUF6290 family protein [Bifidobacterium crudilactis]MCI2157345.1 DUF6290 family protein [Bifidobacterium crudilactis]
MTTMTMRVDDTDAKLIKEYAGFHGMSVSDFARTAMLEKIEDAHDLAALRDAIEADDGTRYTLDQVKKELDL